MFSPFAHITCTAHPDDNGGAGWVTCVHMARDVRTTIGHLTTPRGEVLGQLLCIECTNNMPFALDHLVLSCAYCVGDIMRARSLRP